MLESDQLKDEMSLEYFSDMEPTDANDPSEKESDK
jgi:hypothetical protein